MKKVILITSLLFVAYLGNAQDNWINFKNYPIDINIDLKQDTNTQDAPFVFKNRDEKVFNYILPVKFTAEKQENLSDIIIKIKSIGASYDTKDRLMIYFRGKIDLSSCFPDSVTMEFYDSEDNLIQIAKTDEFGNFKIKSINGSIIEISKGRIKFNFVKIKTFDANADVRYAFLEIYEKPIDNQLIVDTSNTVMNTKE